MKYQETLEIVLQMIMGASPTGLAALLATAVLILALALLVLVIRSK